MRRGTACARYCRDMADSPVSQALFACGKPLDSSETAFGWLRESLPSEAGLAERLHEDGYLYLRGLIPNELISTVREQVLGELRDRGLLEGEDTVREGAKISAFQPELVEQNLDVTRVMFGEELHTMMEQLHGEPVMHYQYVWFRSLGRGMGTAPHCDVVYMGRGTHRIFTSWVVKVLDAMMNSVCSGRTLRSTAARSWPSTFETK